MPRAVDHEQRRATLIDITARHIADVGLGGVRLRDVARAAGWTTGAVSHYFPDKRTLLLMTFRSRAQRAAQRVEAAVAAGSDELFDCVGALLPTDAEQLLTWQVWLAFWGAAVGDGVLAVEQRRQQQQFLEDLIRRIRSGQRSGALQLELDPHEAARSIAALVDGVSVQATFAPELWPPEAQRRIVGRHLTSLLARDTAPSIWS